jgi:hypothetical protein
MYTILFSLGLDTHDSFGTKCMGDCRISGFDLAAHDVESEHTHLAHAPCTYEPTCLSGN